jgi:hypothetical protein
MKEDQPIKDLLQDQFAQYEAEPDRDLWPVIESGLKGARRKAMPQWSRYLAVAASLLLLMGLIWLLRQPRQVPQGPMAERPAQRETVPSRPEEPIPPTEAPPAPEASLAEGPDEGPLESERTAPGKRPDQPTKRPQIEGPEVAQEAQAQRRPTQPSRLHLRPESMTPIHHQLAINQSLTPSPDPEAVPPDGLQVPLPANHRRKVQTVSHAGSSRSLNLNELTLASAVSFASDGLSRWAKSPVEVSEKETTEREVKTFELDILNLKITRKIHKKTK